jgi:hypothetical protein
MDADARLEKDLAKWLQETTEGFKVHHLVRLFGESRLRIGGLLVSGFFGKSDRQGRVTRDAVYEFMVRYDSEYSLKRVHQRWFTILCLERLRGGLEDGLR